MTALFLRKHYQAAVVLKGNDPSHSTNPPWVTGQWFTGLSNGSTAFNTTLWAIWSTGVTWLDVRSGNFA